MLKLCSFGLHEVALSAGRRMHGQGNTKTRRCASQQSRTFVHSPPNDHNLFVFTEDKSINLPFKVELARPRVRDYFHYRASGMAVTARLEAEFDSILAILSKSPSIVVTPKLDCPIHTTARNVPAILADIHAHHIARMTSK